MGGGMAGLALAARLAPLRRSVVVVDKSALPRDKVCGEGLMPMGLDALRQLGLVPEALPGDDFSGLEYRSRRQRVVLSLPGSARGRGIRRTALIAALHRETCRQGTVSHFRDTVRGLIWEENRIAGVRSLRRDYRAAVVIAADGVHSGLARRAGLTMRPRGERMALRLHYRSAGAAPSATVRVGLFAPYDVYLTPLGGGEFVATTMTDRSGYAAIVRKYDRFLRESPFADLFRGASPVTGQMGWWHPLFAPRHYHVGGMLLVGDAGGGVDPCLGVGISMALSSALLAAETVERMFGEPTRRALWERQFDTGRRILFQHFSNFDKIFRSAIRTSPGSELLLWGMRKWPDVAESVLDIVATGHPWKSFDAPALLAPLVPWRRARQEVDDRTIPHGAEIGGE